MGYYKKKGYEIMMKRILSVLSIVLLMLPSITGARQVYAEGDESFLMKEELTEQSQAEESPIGLTEESEKDELISSSLEVEEAETEEVEREEDETEQDRIVETKTAQTETEKAATAQLTKYDSDGLSKENNKEMDQIGNPSESKRSSSFSFSEEENQAGEELDDWMPDRNLQSAVAQSLGISIVDLTKDTILNLRTFNSPSAGISSLKGLEYATNLSGDVNLNYNHISDISPLFSTRISYLRLSDNEISDVSQFRNMPYLTTLVAPKNHIWDLSPIAGSQITTIIATDQTITLEQQEVVEGEFFRSYIRIVRPNGVSIDDLSIPLNGSYISNQDYILWEPIFSNLSMVTAGWDDQTWIKENYNALGTAAAGFSGTIVQPIEFLAVQIAVINVHDSTIYVGDNWSPEDNYDGGLDENGNELEFGYVTVESQVDTSEPGIYMVSYFYQNVANLAMVTVKANQTAINVHDSTIYIGDSWSVEDSFDSALDKDGNTVAINDLTIDTSQVDTSQAGIYEVRYSYDGLTSIARVIVKEKQTAVNVHDSTIYIGDSWSVEDSFDGALDKDGNIVAINDLTIDTSQVDTSQAGIYEVRYSYDGLTSIAKVIVKEKQTAVNVHDSTIYIGDSWSVEDNFDSALDRDGNTVAINNLMIDTSQVDTSQAGIYEVRYSYDGLTSVAKVTVKEKQTAINVHDSTIYIGDNWSVEDNFDSALDKEGNTVTINDLTIDKSQVNTSQAGIYEVRYSYDGLTSVAKITVKEKQIDNTQKEENKTDNTQREENKTDNTQKEENQIDNAQKESNTIDSTQKKEGNKIGNTARKYNYQDKSIKKSNASIPKTGDKSRMTLILAGILISSISLIAAFRKKRNVSRGN
jgi:LPXTG-motif cell wall-anchored protein